MRSSRLLHAAVLLACLLVLANRTYVPIHLLAEPHQPAGADYPAVKAPELRLKVSVPAGTADVAGPQDQARALALAFQQFTLANAVAAAEEQVHQATHRAGVAGHSNSDHTHSHGDGHSHSAYDHEVGMLSAGAVDYVVQIHMPDIREALLSRQFPGLCGSVPGLLRPRGPPVA